MTIEDDPWVAANSGLGIDRIHAVGNVALYWTTCERHALLIFIVILGAGRDAARAIAHDMGDITLWRKIVQLARLKKLDPRKIEELEFASRLYEDNRNNRNSLVHAHIGLNIETTKELMALYRSKGPTFDEQAIKCSVADIRRAADEIAALGSYLFRVALFVDRRRPSKRQIASLDRPSLPIAIWTPPQ